MHKLEQTGKSPDKEYIYRKYNIPRDRKLILYAPTFRDNEEENPKLIELITELSNELSQEYYLGLRLHPFIAETYRQEQLGDRICQFSFEKDLNALLMASDILITDYSSIIFEYCITKRPMIFYAYDFNEFSDVGRGYYYDYEDFVPGPVAYRCKDVVKAIKEREFEAYDIEAFIRGNYMYADGNATKRLIQLIEKK
jgi:CDP-ribitol ribitolphosphotransferase